MGDLAEQIEAMRLRMNEVAAGEQATVRSLSEALGRSDQKLLDDVRTVAAQHEARRGTILSELHGLARRMCSLPPMPDAVARIGNERRELPGASQRATDDSPDLGRSAALQQHLYSHLKARRAG